jgi:hypothetical protein
MRDAKTARRVVTDEPGMAYAMAEDIPKTRSRFEKAVVEDTDYAMNY